MPPPRREERRKVRIGLGLMAAVAVLAIAIFMLDTALRAFSEGPRVTVLATAAPGLGPGSTVWVAGRPVGRVLSVGFRPPGSGPDNVVIRAVLQRGTEPILRADATAEIRSAALLEPVIVVIDPGSPDAPPWSFDDTLRTPRERLDLDALREMSDSLLLVSAELSRRAAPLRERIRRASGTLPALVRDPDVLEEAAARVDRLRVLLEEEYPHGTAGRLVSDTAISMRLSRITDRLAALDTLPGRREASSALESASAAIEGFETRLARLSEWLDEGRGTAGRALVDGALGRQAALLRAQLDSLVVELMTFPERWLRVRAF